MTNTPAKPLTPDEVAAKRRLNASGALVLSASKMALRLVY